MLSYCTNCMYRSQSSAKYFQEKHSLLRDLIFSDCQSEKKISVTVSQKYIIDVHQNNAISFPTHVEFNRTETRHERI